jgi:hypothetical protein
MIRAQCFIGSESSINIPKRYSDFISYYCCFAPLRTSRAVLRLAMELLPEFFLFIGIDFFVALALLSCIMDYFRRSVAYLFEAAAVFGYVNLLMSQQFLAYFSEYMRFAYCFLYLALALASILGVNFYLVIVRKAWSTAKLFAGAITLPAVLISAFFFSLYSRDTSYTLTAALLSSAMVLGTAIAFLANPEKFRDWLGRR